MVLTNNLIIRFFLGGMYLTDKIRSVPPVQPISSVPSMNNNRFNQNNLRNGTKGNNHQSNNSTTKHQPFSEALNNYYNNDDNTKGKTR
jgi:hypothetical protein